MLETPRAFYRRMGWNPGYGHKLKEKGGLVVVVQAGKDLIDVEQTEIKLAQNVDPAKFYMAQVNDRQRAAARGETVSPPAKESQPYSLPSTSTSASYFFDHAD